MKTYRNKVLLLLISLTTTVCIAQAQNSSSWCPNGWTLSSDDICYGLVNLTQVVTSAFDARQACQSRGADLPDVTSGTVQTLLTGLLQNQNGAPSAVYIGLNDIITDGDFVYGESSNITSYTAWAAGQPTTTVNNSVDCVLLSDPGAEWTNVDCCSSQGISWVVCQKPANDTNSTIVEPDQDNFAKVCFQDINECSSQPCLNAGTCHDHVTYYECFCPSGYSGQNCQFDACSNSPCQNNRTCSLSGESYVCDCGDWFNGTNCETVASLCHTRPCMNDATCTGTPNSYECTCLPGYNGTNCQTDIDDCARLNLYTKCQPNGVCVDAVNDARCECNNGFNGEFCDNEISCPGLTIANATSPNDTTATYVYNDMMMFSCFAGHKFPDMQVNKTTRCTNQQWKPILQPCDLHCDVIPSVAHASVANPNTVVGGSINFTCEVGYHFPDDSRLLTIDCISPGNWSIPQANLPDCQVVTCPILTNYPNQELDTTNNTYNTLVTFWCDVGYELHDHTIARTIKCLANGEWTATLPPCEPVKCPVIDMTDVPGNTRNSSEVTYDTYVEYQCDGEKRMVDGSTYRIIRCDATAEWSDNITDCIENRCFPLPYVANATPSALDASYGSEVTLTCIPGHRFFMGNQKYESRSMTCLSSTKRWSPILQACEPIICPNLTIPTKVSLSTTNRLFDSIVNVTCDTGHYYNVTSMEQVRTSHCLENGAWDQVTTQPCLPIPCPEAPDILNGTRTGGTTGYEYANSVHYTCDDGYKFVDGRLQKDITCTEFGTWDDTDMSCRKDRCNPVPEAANVEPDTRNSSWTTVVTYTCKPGHFWPANKMEHKITCNLGTWSDENIQKCDPKVCPVIMKMSNATLSHNDTEAARLYNTVVEYSCDTGFKFPDNETAKTRRCNEAGVWEPSDATFPVCEIINCLELTEVENATRDSNDTSYSTVVNYICDQGYQFPDKDKSKPVTCTENATWTELPQPCEVVFCPPIPLWNEAIFNGTSNEFNAVVTYACKEGFYFSDSTKDESGEIIYDNMERSSNCSQAKVWEPLIVDCTDKSNIAAGLEIPVESKEGTQYGAVAITIIALMVTLIVLLDLNKLYKDIKVMIENIRFCMKKKGIRVSNSSIDIQMKEPGETTA